MRQHTSGPAWKWSRLRCFDSLAGRRQAIVGSAAVPPKAPPSTPSQAFPDFTYCHLAVLSAPLDLAYSPVKRNSACHGPSEWTISQ